MNFVHFIWLPQKHHQGMVRSRKRERMSGKIAKQKAAMNELFSWKCFKTLSITFRAPAFLSVPSTSFKLSEDFSDSTPRSSIIAAKHIFPGNSTRVISFPMPRYSLIFVNARLHFNHSKIRQNFHRPEIHVAATVAWLRTSHGYSFFNFLRFYFVHF